MLALATGTAVAGIFAHIGGYFFFTKLLPDPLSEYLNDHMEGLKKKSHAQFEELKKSLQILGIWSWETL